LLEPDLGTVMLTMPILFVMLYMAGAKVKHLLVIILMGVLISPVLWGQIHPYQRLRISSVLLQSEWIRDKAASNPKFANILVGREFSEKQWERGAGFHLIRSKYAIASGGLTGYGYRKGPFIKYNFFLPERHTDFIFAIIAHQWGFLGSIALLGIYGTLISCAAVIAANNTDPFARLVVMGIVTMFSVETLINISMTLGLMPITGLTLPFVSYGGSSLLTHSIALGLLNNIGRSRLLSVASK
ncbi:MAG TPA: FtsW/RodA/SpoVE family cell cycle protein, partial [Sedimentisphaerales bacterium]|nr:FtsW/RodA/SpoVE family cell cycle protein [Sedimentisphaerales bacterium]